MRSRLFTVFVALAIVVTIPSILSAQQYAKLNGTVVTEDSLLEAIPDALVGIVGGPSIRTDNHGRFELIIDLTGLRNIRLRVSTDDGRYASWDRVLPPKNHIGLDIRLPSATPFIKIVSPEPNAHFACDQVVVRGTSHRISENLNIYVIVHPMAAGAKWVQPNFGPPAQNGSWQQIAALGGIAQFEIWAIATKETIKVAEYPLSQELPAVVKSNTVLISRIK